MKQGTEAFLPTCPNTMLSGGVGLGLVCGVLAAASVVTCGTVGVVGGAVLGGTGVILSLSGAWLVII